MEWLLIALLVVALSCFTLVIALPLRWLADTLFGDSASSRLANGLVGTIFVAVGFGATLLIVTTSVGAA